MSDLKSYLDYRNLHEFSTKQESKINRWYYIHGNLKEILLSNPPLSE